MNSTESVSDTCGIKLENITVYDVFGLITPGNKSTAWSERDVTFFVFFYVCLVVFGLLFLSLATLSAFLLWKRHLVQRFVVRTFIAIDVALIVLGVSRFLFYLLDPWGQSGYCVNYGCTVVSRLLGALVFPSLTASYTLVFTTLWVSAKMQIGRSWVQKYRVFMPICFVHYFVAIVFEIVAAIPLPGQPALVTYLLFGCESVFSLWGVIVCVTFIVAGKRLLRTIAIAVKKSSVVCRDTPTLRRHELVNSNNDTAPRKTAVDVPVMRRRTQTTLKLKHMVEKRQRRAIRKVVLITYATAIIAIVYSMFNFVLLVLNSVILFNTQCPGYLPVGGAGKSLNPGIWLFLQYCGSTIELLLGVLLVYAINDTQPIIKLLRSLVNTSCECCRSSATDGSSSSPVNRASPTTTSCVQTTQFSPTANTKLSPLHCSNGNTIANSQDDMDNKLDVLDSSKEAIITINT